jgi:hypothetical protein
MENNIMLVGFEHYGKNGRNKQQEQENDLLKMNNAIHNNISKYIIIDASESTIKHIRNSILGSYLNNVFDLSNINWNKCHEYACNSLVKMASELWSEGYGTTTDIGKVLKVSCNTVALYLKQGSKLGWCDYNPVEGKRMASVHGAKLTKEVIQLSLDGKYISKFKSIKEASELTGTSRSNISHVCSNKQKTANKFRWMYKDDYDKWEEMDD